MPDFLRLSDLGRFRVPEQVALSASGRHVAITVRWADEAAVRWRTALYVADADAVASGASPVVIADNGASHPTWSPSDDHLAYLWTGGEGTGTTLRLWDGGTGTSRELARGLHAVSNLSWAPDGTRLAFVAAVPEPSPAGIAPPPHVVRDLGYKVDGVGLVPATRRQLHVVDAISGELRWLTDGTFEVWAPSWSPDGQNITFAAARPRTGDGALVADLYRMDSADRDAVERLCSWGGTVAWTGWADEHRLVFAGQRQPGPCQWGTLLVTEPGGGEPIDLLAGFDRRPVTSSSGGTPAAVFLDGGDVLFCAREEGCTWIYTVPLSGGPVKPWLTGEGTVVHGMSHSSAVDSLALLMTSPRSAGDVYVTSSTGAAPRRLTDLNPWLAHVRVTEAEDLRISVSGRVGLHGYLLRGRPAGLDGPTLFDIHGGPDNAWRPDFSPHYLYRQVLVDRGWNVVLLNPRGSDGYGEEFMRHPLGRLGFSEEDDFLLVLDHLLDAGLAVEGQVAVMGASHGGFMTNWLTSRTDRFAAGISVACVANWTSLYGTSSLGATSVSTLLGGAPHEVPERYAASSPLTYAVGARAPTLLLHGENDLMNPIGQSEEWFTALRKEGREVEFVRYPNGSHLFMYRGAISHQLDYAQRIVDWLTSHVGGAR